MLVRRFNTGYDVWTPAKLNLTLDILAKRGDGFHEIETTMVAISLFDTLRFEPSDSSELTLAVDSRVMPSDCVVPADRTNLVLNVLERLREAHGNRVDTRLTGGRSEAAFGGHVTLTKRIPTTAGMGGGSSDAAAALVAANFAWKLGLNREALCQIGAEAGSDVPFFLHRSPAICQGRGERIVSLPSMGRLHFVVVRPPEGLSTARVYAACRVGEQSAPSGGTWQVGSVPMVREVASRMRNGLEPAARTLSPWIDRLRRAFESVGVIAHQMSGSGSAYFGLCNHAIHARRVADRLRAMNLGNTYRAASHVGYVLG